MPINDRMDKENVVPIYHGILSSHYPQQTNGGTENQTLHVLTYKWEMNNENTWTDGGGQHALGLSAEGGVGGDHQDKWLIHAGLKT